MKTPGIKYALIMAAGRGSRMMPLTTTIPKAMAPYGGSTLIARGIDKVRQHVQSVYVTVGYKGAILAEHVINYGVSGLFDTSGRDNAWWIFGTLMRELDEPVFVLTCDNITSLDFELIESDYFFLGSPCCMVIPVTPISGLEGDYIHHEKNLVHSINRNATAPTYCSGIQIINPKKINQMISPTENFYEVWSQLIKIQQLYCSNILPQHWYAADTLEQLNNVPTGH